MIMDVPSRLLQTSSRVPVHLQVKGAELLRRVEEPELAPRQQLSNLRRIGKSTEKELKLAKLLDRLGVSKNEGRADRSTYSFLLEGKQHF